MKELEKQLPDGYELANENPESITLDGDKLHVIVRYAVKPVKDQHAELRAQYELDVETCASTDGLEPWQLWHILTSDGWDKTQCEPLYLKCFEYLRHPHADSIIAYHKCSPEDKKRWQYQYRDSWINCDGEPDWYEHTPAFRLKPRTISVTLQNGDVLEFPEPVREPLQDGDIFWFKPFVMKMCSDFWHNTKGNLQLLADNRVFITQADCQAAHDAIQAILSQRSE